LSLNILIIRLSALGDVVTSLPVAAAIKQLVDGAKITWLVEPMALPLVLNNPAVDEVLVFPGKAALRGLNPRSWDTRPLTQVLQLVAELRARRFDIALDVQGLLKSALLTYLSGAPIRIGFKGTREFADKFLTHPVDVGDYFGEEHHIVDLNLLLVQRLAEITNCQSPSGQTKPTFPLPEPSTESVMSVANWLATVLNAERKRPLCVLIPGTTWESKIWPVEKWCALANMLSEEMGYQIAIVGGASERENNIRIENELKRSSFPALNLTEKTSLSHLLVLFQRSSLVIGADTGPLHLAAATNVPNVIGLYGSTSGRRNGPFGGGNATIALNLSCQPCWSKICPLGTRACLNDMNPDYVLERIKDFLYSQIQR
jgi:heptosyltransferase-1